MDPREVQRQFRAAAWSNPQAIDAFIQGAEGLPAAELAKLVPLLTDKSLMSELAAHKSRLIAFRRLVDVTPDPQLFVPLVKALRPADLNLRAILVELLPKVNNTAGHSELAVLLKQPDIALRKAVAQALRAVGGKSVFDLCTALTKEDHPGRADAIELAATIGGYHAIPALDQVVLSAKPADRLVALKFLGEPRLMVKDIPSALASIARALSDPTEQIAIAAATAFGNICAEEDFHARLVPTMDTSGLGVSRAIIDVARRFPTAQTFAALERRFRMGPNALRLAVLNTIEAIGTDETLPLLTEALAVKHLPVRTRAGEVLSNLAIAKRVNLARTLLWLLRSRDVNVRRIAVDIAKRVGDPTGELWPSLLRFLRDEDWWVRERVMDALVEMAGSQLTRHIVGYMQDPSDVVRRYAVDVLVRLKDPAALGALVRCAMSDTDWWVRERAIEAAALLEDQRVVPYLIDLITKVPELRVACLTALTALKATAAAPMALGLLGDDDPDIRLAALLCLHQVASPEHAPHVQAVVNDEDHRIRAQARDLLNRWQINPMGGVSSGGFKATLSPLDRLLMQLAKVEGDDLILAAGRPPYVKRLGKVMPLEGALSQTSEALKDILWPHLNPAQQEAVSAARDIDFSHEVKTENLRFRANVFTQHTGLSAVFRIVKDTLLTLDQLGVPKVISTFGDLKNGLVLVGGPTGSGKSTTLAAIIDYINRTSARHIISLEDPIEVLHASKTSLVNQREIGTHTRNFSTALRSVLREDPDVLLIGEMRDLTTISFAVTAAETGHLVFGTVHTVSADTTMDRLINAFPSGQQGQVRSMLAESLRAVVCQHLLRRSDRPGRVLAMEIMLNNDAIGNLIRKGKSFQIPSMIAIGREQGMQLMDGDLRRLLKEGAISPEEAYMKANNKKEFDEILNAKDPNAAAASAASTGSATTRPSMPTVAPSGPNSFAPRAPPPQTRPGMTVVPQARPTMSGGPTIAADGEGSVSRPSNPRVVVPRG